MIYMKKLMGSTEVFQQHSATWIVFLEINFIGILYIYNDHAHRKEFVPVYNISWLFVS